jgi:transporter family protein
MTWIWLTIGCGVLNGFWTAGIKEKVQTSDALSFTAAMRWGVGLLLLPLAFLTWQPVPPVWWLFTALSGSFECLSLWMLVRGSRRDYYATYALANTSIAFVALFSPFLLGETITQQVVWGTVLATVGSLWMYYRGHWSWWGLGASFFGAFCPISSKVVIGQGSAVAHASLSFLIGTVFLQLLQTRNKALMVSAVSRRIWDVKWLIVVSAMATICYFSAVQMAPITRVSPLVRVNMIVGFLLSYYWLKERKDWRGRAIGGIILMAGVLLVAWKK